MSWCHNLGVYIFVDCDLWTYVHCVFLKTKPLQFQCTFEDELLLKIKMLHIHLYCLATKYQLMPLCNIQTTEFNHIAL